MTKIMLVEDDKSLREIYGIRLVAEGYEVVSAGDGEEALAMAVQQQPDLIISDVMMPKISGFDMLDILRSTPETKDIKVIMMTALSSDDQRQRGESLGADRYLVKSQVGIEDVINAVHSVLGDGSAPAEEAAPAPVAASATPAPTTPVVPTPTTSGPVAIDQAQQPVQAEPVVPASAPVEAPAQSAPTAAAAPVASETPVEPVSPAQPTPVPQPAPVPQSTGEAMDALLNEAPTAQPQTWPGDNAAQ